ncbi:hypothetical protein F2Q69_00014151 [Brassica cretica]|uniref:Uncharacterized protein n=1 Tax=Brassica cretica TaxID=69181 RepID=A0A8S9R226_BRACR|nr:hypothetical protein F2Q69_00014151 [Brassica cretica]
MFLGERMVGQTNLRKRLRSEVGPNKEVGKMHEGILEPAGKMQEGSRQEEGHVDHNGTSTEPLARPLSITSSHSMLVYVVVVIMSDAGAGSSQGGGSQEKGFQEEG